MTCSPRWPHIVAEALGDVAEPLTTIGGPPHTAHVRDVLAIIRGGHAPGRIDATPPAFLYPTQQAAWQRASYALRHWGGAMLAEPVGSGKTWIALAVAASERTPALVIAPAILLGQWQRAASEAGVNIDTWSHERLSRGSLPPRWRQLIIVDESHRFRSPGIRRVRALAPHLVGRRALLLTATPIVNRARDLVEQLRLIMPEDALALDGIPTLGALENAPAPPPALRRLVIRDHSPPVALVRSDLVLPMTGSECARARAAVSVIAELILSRSTAVRRLMRSVLLDAAGSSDAAFHAALKRYRALLLQARDGGRVSRSALRQLAGPELGQLVMWELMDLDHDSELVTDDLPAIERAICTAGEDAGWADDLLSRLSPDTPTICFARHRATAHLLRRTLGDGTAWVTGNEAGIGPHRLPRAVVLEAFGPQRTGWNARRTPPLVLIATDVAAEGLDLQAAGRIVHVDLPWTAMRMDQREGRLLRLGQHHAEVQILVRRPAPDIERLLMPVARLTRKHRLATNWAMVLEREDGELNPLSGRPSVAAVADALGPAELVLVVLSCGNRTGARLLSRMDHGAWVEEERPISELLARADVADSVALEPRQLREPFTAALRAVFATSGGSRTAGSTLIGRIQKLARVAATRRDNASVATLDRMLAFAATPQPLGGRMLLDQWRALPDQALLRTAVPPSRRPEPVAARVAAAILFRSTSAALR